MILTDKEIIKKLKIKSSDKVLDIGGSMRQHTLIKVDTLVDIIRPEEAPYGSSKLLADHFVKVNITRNKLPFKNKEFDVVLCTHTLEDLPNPFLIMNEMSRVAKRGIIVTPSMGIDMVFSDVDLTDWLTGPRRVPGQAHHKWFFIKTNKGLKVIPKNFPILYTSDFHVVSWGGEKEMIYYWQGNVKYDEFISLEIHALIDEYQKYIKINKKYIKKGVVLFFLDSPFRVLKSVAKLILKRGNGYIHRHSF